MHTHKCMYAPTILLCSITPSMLRVSRVPSTTVTDLSDSDVDGEIASCMCTDKSFQFKPLLTLMDVCWCLLKKYFGNNNGTCSSVLEQ